MKIFVLLILTMPLFCFSQEFDFQFEPEAFPVEIEGWQPFCPWAGGYSETAPDFCDIDADGDLDLFIGEYFGWVSFFEDVGDSSTPDFNLVTREYDSLLTLEDWGHSNPDFFDLDNDNDKDAIIGGGRVTFIENMGSQYNPNFISERDTLFDVIGNWVFGTHISIVDIDMDGDGDLICGEYQGHLQFYRNVGTPDSFAFYLEDDNWLGINVGGYNGYADPTLIDIDSDNDYDLFIGDNYGHIHYYRNEGDSVQWDYVLVSAYFDSIDVGDYASPEFADVDGDGDYDMLVGREGDYITNLRGDIFYYENIGTQYNYQFRFITKNYIVIDEGHFSFPQFVDIDADNDLDFITNCEHGLKLFENIGDSVAASFQLIDENFQNINQDYPFTYFVDIDADDDLDLFAGQSVIPGPPTIALYINQGTPEVPDLVLFNLAYISNPDFFVNVNPVLVDIDADNDYDLIISDDHGYFYFYQNDGDSTSAQFTFVTDEWQGITLSPYNCWRGMSFGDLDDDGDLDLLMDNIWQYDYCNLRFYRNIGTAQNAIMQFETNVFLPGIEIIDATPILTDIDYDGDLDIFCGGSAGTGGIMFFRNLEVNSVNEGGEIVNRSFSLLPNYPNPFNSSTVIPFTLDRTGRITLTIYNQLGQEVDSFIIGHSSFGKHEVVWDAFNQASGMYYVRLSVVSGQSSVRKMTLVK